MAYESRTKTLKTSRFVCMWCWDSFGRGCLKSVDGIMDAIETAYVGDPPQPPSDDEDD